MLGEQPDVAANQSDQIDIATVQQTALNLLAAETNSFWQVNIAHLLALTLLAGLSAGEIAKSAPGSSWWIPIWGIAIAASWYFCIWRSDQQQHAYRQAVIKVEEQMPDRFRLFLTDDVKRLADAKFRIRILMKCLAVGAGVTFLALLIWATTK
ncbi:RipA family octameric membrane protein [Desertibaculum subflavum]|uniref:RipA family octameric membrane protein n=1 Tax=Desertibaculum subflavum TaxID=2268458 RepID=UPI000E6671EF